jgi:hypothetical protein
MIISHARRFVLLATWKAATSTCHLRLGRYNESPYSRFYYYCPHLWQITHQHITYAQFGALPEAKAGYFTAAFARNPYDRVYSGFLQLQRDIRDQPGATYPSTDVKLAVSRQLAANLQQLAAADFDFDRWLASVDEAQVFDVGRNSSFPLHPSHFWTGADGSVDVDFVGRVERFEADFRQLCGLLDLEPPEELARQNANQSAPMTGGSGFGYRYLHKMSAASIDKIDALFRTDFDLFGYKRAYPAAPIASSAARG